MIVCDVCGHSMDSHEDNQCYGDPIEQHRNLTFDRNVIGLGETVTPEQIADLKERLQRAQLVLRQQGEKALHPRDPEFVRLRGKAEGVGLALSYLNEYQSVQSPECAVGGALKCDLPPCHGGLHYNDKAATAFRAT